MVFALEYFYSQFFFTPPYPTDDFTGQTVIVTGSNTGLGLEAARHLVRLNAEKVILAVRNLEKGEAAKGSIEASEKKIGVVEVWELDLASHESVQRFAKRAEGLKRLDAISGNAAIYTYQFKIVDGNESTMTVNVINTFLLALLLLPKMRETAVQFNVVPRISLVASFVHYLTSFPQKKEDSIFDYLNKEGVADMNDRYNVSKIIEIFGTREMAKLMEASPKEGKVILNCLNPGHCRSEMMRETTGMFKYFVKGITALMARTTEVGARTLIAGVAAEYETHGTYMDDSKVGK